MYHFVISAIGVLIVWGLYALGSQGLYSTKKKPGDKLSESGSKSLEMFIFIVIVVGIAVLWGLSIK